jgi:chemosensory pili system protein ChpA (sensor histidine kinase/response regulator)
MSAKLAFDSGPLSWVKPEIDHALERCRVALEKFCSNPAEVGEIKAAQIQLHQVSGALQVVALGEGARFCEEIERLLKYLDNPQSPPTRNQVGLVSRALAALSRYLDDLMAGEPNFPMALWPLYEELRTAQGVANVTQTQFFFPDLSVRPARLASATAIPERDLATLVKVQRGHFQRGMVNWLKNNEIGLAAMREALAAVEQAQPLPHQRAFWYVAVGLLEALLAKGLEASISVKKFFARIDQHMRAVTEGANQTPESLMREILYYLARSQPVTERVKEVKQLYQLEQYLAGSSQAGALAAAAERMQPVLRQSREELRAAKEAWVKYSSGNSDSLAAFRDHCAKLEAALKGLREPPLLKLFAAVVRAAAVLPARLDGRGEEIGLEMATGLLLAETALERFGKPMPQLGQQVDAVILRLSAALSGKHAAMPEVDLIDEIGRRAQEKMLAAQVVNEIQSNLAQIEQVLDGFFRDASKRSELPQLKPALRQVRGAFTVMGEELAMRVLAACEKLIERMSEPDYRYAQAEAELLADGLSSLGFYIATLTQNRTVDKQMLEMVLTRFSGGADKSPRLALEQADAETGTPAHAAAVATLPFAEAHQALDPFVQDTTSAQPDGTAAQVSSAAAQAENLATRDAIDQDLLAIFLEEAQEVLAVVARELARVREELHNRDALATIRRGFHTLKGSGRMVGLTDLGEAAWGVEQVMNQWLQVEKNATPQLMNYVALAHDSFQRWIAALTLEGGAEVDVKPLIQLAEQVKVSAEASTALPQPAERPEPGIEAAEEDDEAAMEIEAIPAEQQPQAAAEALEISSAPEPEKRGVQIDDSNTSNTLFQLYLEEARHHVATLKREIVDWRTKNPYVPPSQEFMRAAHTLSSISRTTGMGAIAELASLLEKWIVTLMRSPFVPGLTPMLSMDSAIDKLTSMLDAVEQGRTPESADRPKHELELMLTQALLRYGQEPVDSSARKILGQEPRSITGLAAKREPVSPQDERIEVCPSLLGDSQAADILVQIASSNDIGHETRVPLPALDASGQAAIGDTQLWRMNPSEAPDRRVVCDDIDQQLLPIFLEEVEELTPAIGEDLRRWRTQDAEASHSLQRALHTLKGSARMVGAMRLGELIHAMENEVVEGIECGSLDSAVFNKLESQFDRALDCVDALKRGQAWGGDKSSQEEVPETAAELPANILASQVMARTHAPESDDAAPAKAFIRVSADVVDRLVDQAGEVSIARSRIESEVRTFKQALHELTDSTVRLKTQLREIEIHAESQLKSRLSQLSEQEQQFDPLEFDRYTRLQELTRLMAESVHDVVTVQQGLVSNLNETQAALLAQARMNRQLQDDLMQIRAVPFSSLAERLYRVVRQAAKDLKKKANLDIVGQQVEVDRGVLEKIAAPLEHLLRNAVAHGIEAAEARLAAGKPEFGEIALSLRQEANEIVITLADDGRGLDYARIRGKALELGLVRPEDDPTRTQFANLIFSPGFSTASEVSEIAGRGIGMDVVRSDVQALGGRIELSSEVGRGTTFTLYLPLTLAVTQALLVRAGHQLYGIPSSMVEQVQQYKTQALDSLYDSGAIVWLGNRYPFRCLAHTLGDSTHQPEVKLYNAVILVRTGESRLAVHVDELIRNQEVVLKSLGPQLSRVPGLAGATVLPNGQAVLIINPVQLAEARTGVGFAENTSSGVKTQFERISPPLAMVVDDSLTVRKITGRLLARHGYEVITAKDGVDALQQLQETIPDVLLVDIEMPRMDGLELVKNVRGDARMPELPIIMITSRTADKHRSHAQALGVNLFLGKPYKEEELLEHVASFCRRADQRSSDSVATLAIVRSA